MGLRRDVKILLTFDIWVWQVGMAGQWKSAEERMVSFCKNLKTTWRERDIGCSQWNYCYIVNGFFTVNCTFLYHIFADWHQRLIAKLQNFVHFAVSLWKNYCYYCFIRIAFLAIDFLGIPKADFACTVLLLLELLLTIPCRITVGAAWYYVSFKIYHAIK